MRSAAVILWGLSVALLNLSAAEIDPAAVVWQGPAYKYPQDGWLVVHIEGSPYDRGYQHGRLLAEEMVDYQQTLAAFRSAKDPASGWRDLRLLTNALVLRTYKHEYLEEMQGIADGASAAGGRIDGKRIELADIATLNSFIEIDFLAKAMEATPTGLEGIRYKTPPLPMDDAPTGDHCSAFAAAGPATIDGNIVFGHITMFSLPVVRHFNVWLDIQPTEGRRVLMQGYPGAIQSGLDYYFNDAGLLLTETTIAQTSFNVKGSSVASRIRQAAQYAESIDQAVEILIGANNGLYTNEWMLADIKTGEIALFELGTAKTKLWRSKKAEWPGNTTGFYWGCNNAKDQALRLETLPKLNDKPASTLYVPKDRDMAWLELYGRHQGKITQSFGFEAFGSAPLVGYTSCDAKFTDTQMAKKLETWALFGPPLGRTWMPKPADLARGSSVKPLVANDWTILKATAPAKRADDAKLAVDLKPFRKQGEAPKVDPAGKLTPAWRGTLLPKTDADIWLSSAFADYEKIVALEQALLYESKGKPLDGRAKELVELALFKKFAEWRIAERRTGGDIPLSKVQRTWTDPYWHKIAAGKGSILLHQIRQAVGGATFDRLMDEFGLQHAGQEVNTADFVQHFAPAGAEVGKLFDQYLTQSAPIAIGPKQVHAVDSFEDEPTKALIVYGTLGDKAAQKEAAEFLQKNIAARWCNTLLPIKADVDLTDAEAKSHHLLLIGRPATNTFLQQHAAKLPIAFGPTSFTIAGETYAHPASAVVFACNHPLSERYSLVIHAGLSADTTWRACQAIPDLGGRGSPALLLAHAAKPRAIKIE